MKVSDKAKLALSGIQDANKRIKYIMSILDQSERRREGAKLVIKWLGIVLSGSGYVCSWIYELMAGQLLWTYAPGFGWNQIIVSSILMAVGMVVYLIGALI